MPHGKNRGAKRPRTKKRLNGIPWAQAMRLLPCLYCGGPGGTVDHVIPEAKGGESLPSNCVPACEQCNNFRHGSKLTRNLTFEQFKEFGWKRRPFA